ncbi:hypothetical protein CPC08DRAFT_731692, partial [Agrocybe pediades]
VWGTSFFLLYFEEKDVGHIFNCLDFQKGSLNRRQEQWERQEVKNAVKEEEEVRVHGRPEQRESQEVKNAVKEEEKEEVHAGTYSRCCSIALKLGMQTTVW